MFYPINYIQPGETYNVMNEDFASNISKTSASVSSGVEDGEYMWKSYIDSEAFSTVLYQLSYQVKGKRIIVWVHGNSVVEDGGRCTIYFKVIQLNCGVRNKFNFIIAVLNAIWSKGRGHLKISVLDRILTLTSAKPIESVDCSTSWAIRYYY